MGDFNTTKHPPNRVEQWITESTDNQGEDFAKTLQLNEICSKTRHDTPHVIKTETREVTTAQDGSRDTKDGGQQAIAPVLRTYEG